ncbi:MAG: hypothetical protein KDA41_15275, partial [Planctomycetales bacterium]|nr:hypothetical protein [Planctomycetales bacterium]
DGLSNTVMLVEAADASAVAWSSPSDLPVDLEKPLTGLLGQHEQGFVACMADGYALMFSKDIDAETLSRLFQRKDGQIVSVDQFDVRGGR